MKKITTIAMVIVLVSFFIACDVGAIQYETSTIEINVAVPLVVEDDIPSTEDSSRAILDFKKQKVTVTATTDSKEVASINLSYNKGKKVFSGAISVPLGSEYTFTIEAKDVKGTVYASGSDEIDVQDKTEKFAITLAPVLPENIKTIDNVYFAQVDKLFEPMISGTLDSLSELVGETSLVSSFEGVDNGVVNFIRFIPLPEIDISDDDLFDYNDFSLPYIFKTSSVKAVVCNTDGKVLSNSKDEWTMNPGDEVIVMYVKTGLFPSFIIYPNLDFSELFETFDL